MKKILAFAVLTMFVIMPSLSSAKITSISDSDLGDISAQAGSITISFDDIILKNSVGNRITNKTLKSVATDGYNYWDPNHGYESPYERPERPYPQTPNLGIKNKNKYPGKYPGAGYFDQDGQTSPGPLGYVEPGYFGYEAYLTTDGLVRRAGSMTMQVFEYGDDSTTYDTGFYVDRNIWSRCVLKVMVGYKDMGGLVSDPLKIDTGNMGILAVLKLSDTPDISNGQSLGRIYTGRVTATAQGAVTVHSHNQLAGSAVASRLGPVK